MADLESRFPILMSKAILPFQHEVLNHVITPDDTASKAFSFEHSNSCVLVFGRFVCKLNFIGVKKIP